MRLYGSFYFTNMPLFSGRTSASIREGARLDIAFASDWASWSGVRNIHHVLCSPGSLHGRAIAYCRIATDSKLGCNVAIKVLLARIASDSMRISTSGTCASSTSGVRNRVL